MITDTPKHFLYPSTLYAGSDSCSVKTILGSCVAVCLYDKKLKQGGMNHYLLPTHRGTEDPSPKYGNVAIYRLIEKLKTMGSQPKNLIAKIFGGSDQHGITHLAAGQSNIEMARAILKKYNIEVIEEDTGGTKGRTVTFHTQTGETQVDFVQAFLADWS